MLILAEFKIFASINLILTGILSAMIVNTIKKGDIKEDIYNIPIYVIVSLFLFFISAYFLSGFLEGFMAM